MRAPSLVYLSALRSRLNNALGIVTVVAELAVVALLAYELKRAPGPQAGPAS